MDNLFLLLFLISIVCLIAGIIKPSVFSRFIKGEITRKRIGKIFGITAIASIVLFGATTNSSKNNEVTQQPTTEINQKEIKMLWDIPSLMNKSHNQITKILGNPTVVEKLSDGKIERFKFVDNNMESFFEENLPARIGMKTTVYNIYYKQSDCEMMVCGNDLTYSYTNPDQSVKYFFIDNYPVEKPVLSVAELKQIGNLNATDNNTIKVIPALMYDHKSIFGIDICEKNYQGDINIEGSESCSK